MWVIPPLAGLFEVWAGLGLSDASGKLFQLLTGAACNTRPPATPACLQHPPARNTRLSTTPAHLQNLPACNACLPACPPATHDFATPASLQHPPACNTYNTCLTSCLTPIAPHSSPPGSTDASESALARWTAGRERTGRAFRLRERCSRCEEGDRGEEDR